jgi:hypothetical protein
MLVVKITFASNMPFWFLDLVQRGRRFRGREKWVETG